MSKSFCSHSRIGLFLLFFFFQQTILASLGVVQQLNKAFSEIDVLNSEVDVLNSTVDSIITGSAITLNGDVTGQANDNTVQLVGGQSAVDIAAATLEVMAATSTNTPETLVMRDAAGNFSVGMITVEEPVVEPSDVATKAYVDASVVGVFIVKEPALVTSTTNVSLSGTGTIDGVGLAPNDRVLLVGQTNPIDNGLWLSEVGSWTRPLDFATGTSAGTSYVLTSSGFALAGTSWVCDTPTAIIGTDANLWLQFSSASQTTAANVGGGIGQLFRDKTGNTLNFKTLANSNHMVITNNANDVNLATDATNANTPSTIVARDASGIFSASEIRLQDSGSNYVGLRAPTTVTASYSVDMPPSSPAAGQVLQATSAATTTWATVGGDPVFSKTYFVSLSGSDSNDGSYAAPFRTVKYAVNIANGAATLDNPVAIYVGAGIFVEDNSGGPITVSSSGISIIGSSLASTIISPSTLNFDLFSVTSSNVECTDFSLTGSAGSTASAVNQATSGYGRTRYSNIAVSLFQTAFDVSAAGIPPAIFLENIQSAGVGTCFVLDNVQAIISGAILRGPTTGGAANVGMSITGTTAEIQTFNSSFSLFNTAIEITGGATQVASSCDFTIRLMVLFAQEIVRVN